MADYVVAQAAVLIVPTLEKFREKLNKELQRIQMQTGPIEIDGKFNSKRLIADFETTKAYLESRDINVNARINPKQLTEIRQVYEDLSRDFKKGLVANVKVTGMSVLPELAQGLAAANASMVQLAQSAVLLPGILATAASSIATVVTGLGGLKEAFKEYSDGQKNAAQEGLKARNSAKNVQNAYRDLGRSIKDAKRNLEDLNAELRGAPLDEADAIIAVAEARAEAADKAGKSGLQQQKDILNLMRAENGLVDVRLRNSRLVQDVAEANAKGVAGADAVVEANERVAKATDEANTQTTKLTDSLKQVSPNAQKFFQAVTGMQSQWEAFKSSTQDRLLSGLDQEITQLAQVGLPTLQKGFGSIADAVNDNVKTAFDALEKPSSQGFLENIFGNTADAQERLSKSIEPFLDGFLRLSEVGSGFMPRLVDGLGQLAQRFENFITLADNNGSLDKWIENGIEAFSDLGSSIGNIGSILNSLSEAFTGSGGTSFLELLQEGTERLAEFLKSDEGQQRLIELFKESREILKSWQPFLSQLPGLFNSVQKAAQDFADKFLPVMTTIAKLIGDHPALVSAVLQAYLGFQTIFPVIKGVKKLLDSELVATLKTLATEAGKTGGAIAKGLWNRDIGAAKTALSDSITQIAGLITPGGLLMTGLTALVGYLGYQYIEAQNEAAQEAQNHANALRNIGTQIDSVSGKLTQKGLIDQLRELGNYSNINLTGDPNFRLDDPNQLAKVGQTPTSVARALTDDGGLAALQIANRNIVREALLADNNNMYQQNKQIFDTFKISLEDVVAAVTGDKEQSDRIERATSGKITSSDILQGYNNPLGNFGDVPGLGEKALIAATLNKGVEATRREGAGESARVDAAVGATGGTATLKSDSPWERLGVEKVVPLPDGSGGVAIVVNVSEANLQLDHPDLWALISEKNGSTEANAGDSTTITFSDPVVAQEYANIEKRASGGLIRGPGGPRSDSILTALSNGEYVVNAKATQENLPLLESINGGGMPGFNMGGPVLLPQAPTPTPTPPSPGSGLFGSNNWAAPGASPDFPTTTLLGPNGSAGAGGAPAPLVPFVPPIGQGTDVPNPELPAPPPKGDVPAPPSRPAVPPFRTAAQGEPGFYDPATGKLVAGPNRNPANPYAPLESTGLSSPLAGANPASLNAPLAAESGYQKPLVTPAAGSLPGIPGKAITPVNVPGVTAEVNFGAKEAARYGLRVSSGLREGDKGFHGTGHAGDYSNQVQFGPPTPEMNAFANDVIKNYAPYIDELIYAGVPQNVYRGQLVPAIDMEGSPYTTEQAQYHGDHVHIAWKPGALEKLAAAGKLPTGSSPSNMLMALTPTGVGLPQLSYATNGSGSGTDGSSGMLSGIRLPTPEEYAKYVTKSWTDTIDNLVKNAGQIAIGFLGSFFGLDLSKLTGLANSVMSGIDLPGMDDDEGDGSGDVTSTLGAIPDVAAIIEAAKQVPPEYQQAFIDAATANPAQAGAILQQVMDAVGGATSAVASASLGANPSQSEVVSAIVSKAKARGYSKDEILAILATAYGESGWNPSADGGIQPGPEGNADEGDRALGVFQQKPKYWPNPLDANQNIDSFLDALDKTKGGSGTIFDRIVSFQKGPPASYYAKYLPQAQEAAQGILGYASGGMIKGRGSGKSDSMIARVSNGEYVVKADAARKHMGLLDAINGGNLPGFANGGPIINPMFPPPPPPPVPPVTTPPPPPAPVPPDPGGPAADAAAGIPAAPTPVTENAGPGDAESAALKDVGAAIGGIGEAVSGVADGASAPAGGNPEGDPRAEMGAAPQNLDHNKPAVSAGIQAAGSAISGAISTAMSVGSAGASLAAPGAGAGLGSASGIISGLIGAGAGAVSGAVNVLSSLGVGTVTPSTSTAGAYGAPLTPQAAGQESYKGPSVVNNWNGGVHTSNNEEFYKLQQRRELQNAAPYLPQR